MTAASLPSEQPHINESLRTFVADNGPLATKISQAKEFTSAHRLLAQRMLDRLRGIVRQIEANPNELIPSNIIAAVTLIGTYEYREPVLADCIIHLFWPDFKNQEHEMRAMQSLVANFDVYQDLLGDFISEPLRELAKLNLAYQSYDLVEITNFRHVDDARTYLYKREQRIVQEPTVLGIPTGIGSLDAAISGLNGITILAGPAGVGKTDVAINICGAVLKTQSDVAVMFLQFDLEKDRVFDRFVCNFANVTESEVLSRELSPERKTALDSGLQMLSQFMPRLDVMSLSAEFPFDVNVFMNRRLQFMQKNGCRRTFIVVDYFQLLTLESQSLDSLEVDRMRWNLLSQIQDSMSRQNPRGDDAFLIISEVRKSDSNRDLVIEDILGAARAQFVAENVIMLQSTNSDFPTTDTSLVEMLVAKTRRGHRTRIPLTFHFRQHRFVDVSSRLTPVRHARMVESAAQSGSRSKRTIK